jgi:serine/threonine protein kinase/tetratricopeptide (TPR) repeat protein
LAPLAGCRLPVAGYDLFIPMSVTGAPPPDPNSDAETATVEHATLFHTNDLLCNRFRVVRFIARGGMGELYEAEDLTLGEHIALKTVRPEIAKDARSTQRFRREVQLARKVTHANICRIFDLFEHVAIPGDPGAPDAAFVTMELLHGETISQRISRSGTFSPAEALPVVRQMAAALSAAHAAGIVHRDFKSNNVMLIAGSGSQPLRVVVTDFGLAHRMDEHGNADSTALTATGDLVGTPDYMAPEQVEGKPVTPAADIYALGVVLYEMMTCRRPFKADTPLGSALQRISGPPPKTPRQLNHRVPAVWDHVIMRCLSRRPEDRYPDAMAVVEALGQPESQISSADAAPTRSHVPAIVGALLVAAILGALAFGGGAAWLNWANKSSPTASAPDTARRSVAVLGFRNLAGREDVRWLSTALSEMLTTELAAAELVRAVPGENVNRMKAELELADADAYNAETLARIRRNVGADLVVSGSYVTVGDGDDATLRLDIRIQDAQKGQTLSAVSESGKSAELLTVVSRAGAQLRDRLGMTAVPDAMAALGASRPSSAAAARFYAEGLMRLRRFDALGARSQLEQAIQADPKFPLAYSALATTWSALGNDSKAKEAATQAFELSENLPRADRLLVEGTFHEMSSKWKEAIGIWQTLATFFPDDVEFALRLANAQIASGAPKDAFATLENFRTRFPAVTDPRLDLSEALADETLSDFTRMQAAAAAAGKAGEAQGATLLVAMARQREAEASLRSGQTDRSVALFEEARAIYSKAGDQAGVARALNGLASAISEGPDTKRANALYDEGLRIARTIGKQDLVARFLNNIAIQYRRAGDLQTSLRLNQESLAIRREIGDRTSSAVSLNNIGNVLLDMGDVAAASKHYEESAAMCREIGDRRGEARALFNAGEAFRQQGEVARSRATYDEALKIRRTIADPAGVASSTFGVGQIAVIGGDLVTGKQSITEALDMDIKLNRTRPIAFDHSVLGDIALLENDVAEARRRHQNALDMRVKLGEQGTAAESRAALAVLDLLDGKAAEAETLARSAATTFVSVKAPPYEAMSRATLALALLAQGKHDQAVREVATAQSLLTQPQQVMFRLPVSIAAARVKAVREPDAALKSLEAIRAESVRRGLPRFEFEARLAMAEIEAKRSPAAGQKLKAELARDAKAKGFSFYAR